MPITPGTRLGSYVVQDFLGQGAMGVVYRAYHASLERPAAVKILQGLAPDADSVARFRREAQSIGRMRHPNVLNVFDYGEFEGSPYMIVEFVEGGSLAGRLTQTPMDRGVALRYLAGIGEALDYAHDLGIVHRDVKPANVLIGAHDAPILADFGLAKLLQSSSVKSMTGVTTGTPAYMAPEQVTGSQVGPAADRYSLAVMAYEMLTGSLPFNGDNVLEVLYAHVHRDPAPPCKVNESLPAKVDEVVLRGMAKDPAARWESCAAFVAALRSSLGEAAPVAAVASTLPVAAAAAAVPEATLPAAAVAATALATEPVPAPSGFAATTAIAMPPPRKRSRRPLLFAIAAGVLAVVLVIGAVVVYGATRPPSLAVTPAVVHAGDHVVVSAHHLPRNQAGEIQLVGTEHTAPFRAGANGDVSQEFGIPRDTSPGGYIIKICWDGACHASANVSVIAPVAFVTPGTSPSAGAASATPTPGVSPSPSARAGSSPTSAPTHAAASPTAAGFVPPCPAPSSLTASLTASPTTVMSTYLVAISGTGFNPSQNFSPQRAASVTYYAGTSPGVSKGTTFVTCSGTVSTSVKTTAYLGVTGRMDKVTVCDGAGRCASALFKVIA